MLRFAEYIWIDGADDEKPVQTLRSKGKVVEVTEIAWEAFSMSQSPVTQFPALSGINWFPANLPVVNEWNFDGSSTKQAKGGDSERLLMPVRTVPDPLREGSFLVLCEVLNPDGTPHESNQRAKLTNILNEKTGHSADSLESLWGFEQEYCFMDKATDNILGWPATQRFFPKPQGEFYCGVGCDEVVGRDIAYEHADACIKAGLLYYGHNAEVMLGQWEFQIGHRGFDGDYKADALVASDHLWLARYLLYRIGEKHNVYATLTPKPIAGDWNGSGMHTNFSDKFTRDKIGGRIRIMAIREAMEKTHFEHQKLYGHGNKARLSGRHETAPYEKFSMGQADRGASIRIPNKTQQDGYGYLEDRRPAANADPYVVTNRILKTLLTCG